jgi:hypothetical protein
MTLCRYCGWQAPEGYTDDRCHVCGRPLGSSASPWETGTAPIKRYFGDIWQISTNPSTFFRRMPLSGGVSWPLAFALITHWVGTAIEYLWRASLGGRLARHIGDIFKIMGDVADVDHPGRSDAMNQIKNQVIHWFWGAGSVVVDPFLTIISVLFTSLLVFIGARILVTPGKNGSPREITFESALRIICFGMAPAVFAGIPLAGGVIASLWVLLVTIVGAKVVFSVGYLRAGIIVLFPKLLFVSTLLFGLMFLAVAVLKLLASAF